MNHLLIPLIFMLFLLTGYALADPTEYMAFDYESGEMVLVQPQGDDTVIIVDQAGESTIEIIVDDSAEMQTMYDIETGDTTTYLEVD